VNDK